MPLPVWHPGRPGELIVSPTQDVEGTFLVHVKVRGALVDKDGQRRPDLAEALRLAVDDAVRNEMMFEVGSLDETDFVQEILEVHVSSAS